jgi:hypothetical protein
MFIRNYNRTLFIRINCVNEPTGYAEIPDNWIFLWKIVYIGSSQFGWYYLNYVPTSKPFAHASFEISEVITLYSTWPDNR